MASDQLAVEIETTRVTCAGAAAAFLLRRLGALNGGYAPGVQDMFLRELATERDGGDLPRVASWFANRSAELARLGNRIGARMVAIRTPIVLDWVAGGQGHRGAVLVTAGDILHPGSRIQSPHALAIACESSRPKNGQRAGLVGHDPWPGKGRLSPLPAAELEDAHRRCHHRAFLLYSYGWS
ncbi:MAG TPA: hypothetical protein VK698_38970 [Kofleriaceae bacterium]|nr:hypothetical protein [Kofleriaceae bacterium]